MGRLFTNLTPEQEQAFVKERRKFAFLAANQKPLNWLMPANRHKMAADILYEIAYESNEREMIRLLADIKDGVPNSSVSKILAGQELFDHLNTQLLGDYFLLAGYAIECILKGYLIALIPELVKDEKQLDELISIHNLCQLCHECSITLSHEEEELLKLITRYISWGKYAAPLYLNQMPSGVDPEDDRTKSLSIANPFHEKRVQVLVNGVFQRGLDLINSLNSL